MKRQLTIAVMIAIMAVTISSVGSISVIPASAQTNQASSLRLLPLGYYTVNIGKNQLWTGLQYNYRDTEGVIGPSIGTHQEHSVLDVITTNLAWSKASPFYETSIAEVGVQLQLAGTITPQQWETLSNTPVSIRIHIPYTMYTTNGGATRLIVDYTSSHEFVTLASVQNGAKTGLATFNMQVRLGDIFRPASYGSDVYTGSIYVVLQSYAVVSSSTSMTTASGSASGAAAVSYISIQWPKAA